jgi:hypothetical protein
MHVATDDGKDRMIAVMGSREEPVDLRRALRVEHEQVAIKAKVRA